MKATLFDYGPGGCTPLTAYEKGDEPTDRHIFDLHPRLINDWQRARLELTKVEEAISEYLHATEQIHPPTKAKLCQGCDVREPYEHRCHGAPCVCPECREADTLFGPAMAPVRAFYEQLADMDVDTLEGLDMVSLVEDLGRALGIEA